MWLNPLPHLHFPMGRIYSMLLLSSFFFGSVLSSPCVHCAGTIPDCSGGDSCPLISAVVSNAAALLSGAAGLMVLVVGLPLRIRHTFTRTVLDNIASLKGRYSCKAPVDTATKTNLEIYDLYSDNQMKGSEASRILVRRMVTETDPVIRTNLQAMLDAVNHGASRSKDEKELNIDAGALPYTWRMCLEYVQGPVKQKSAGDTTSDHKAGAQKFPKTQEIFFEALNVFIMICATTSLVHPIVLTSFLQKVVYETMRHKGYSWMMVSELLMVYFEFYEDSEDPSLSFSNLYERGGIDAHAEQAVKVGILHHGPDIFRKLRVEPRGPKGGKERDEDDVKSKKIYNNKFSTKSKMPCQAYNRGNQHAQDHLHPDGTCKFNHFCSHWVSDKGPAGVCGNSAGSADHKWGKCDNPAKCDDKVGA